MQVETTWRGLEELRGALRGLLLRHCADENEVDDVIQETFLRAARHRTQIEPDRLRPWAMRIALNVLADFRRRGRRFVNGSTCDQVLDSLESREGNGRGDARFAVDGWVVDRETALGSLTRSMGDLREDDRRVLGSFYGGAQSCRETASECGIPAHLVKIRLFRARRRLLRLVRRRLALGSEHGLEAGRP